jgi:DNA-directed RNA polymerase subunit RPC12/RpoP
MSSTIFFRCVGCNARIKAPSQLRGQTRACPGCGHRFVVRRPTPGDEGPALVFDEPAPRHDERPRW